MSISLELRGICRTYVKDNESFLAVDNVNLTVSPGEFLTFLGPSGCGKTTTLRMIAGFEIPSSGQIIVDGSDITQVPANKRDMGFVFQNYALFPHMTIFENVAYGLRIRGLSGDALASKVREGLAMVGLGNAEQRYPNQLSGGEQQRVALARVLVLRPKILLMDEPLSNLDAKLRLHMRTEIRRIQQDLRITCLYVTHDQKEALTMSDRIMVMNRGRIEQVMLNVLSNAVKYTPDGGHIRVTAGSEGETVWMEVADDGIGIPEADRSRIFERFYRVDKARSRESGGTGLGLSIATEIVQRHHGSLTLVDRPGPGTTVRLELPITQPAPGAPGDAAEGTSDQQ
mgnify:CR=1 FL=1